MKVKRFFLRTLELLVTLMITLVIVSIMDNDIFSLDEASIQESYKIKKEKCELLKTLPSSVIVEGEGINIKAITNKEIKYNIYNEGDNIIFYYYIRANSSKNPYYAIITLSNNYKILDEKFGIELQDYETHKFTEQFAHIILITVTQVIPIFLIVALSSMGVHQVIRWWMKRRKKNQSSNKPT